MVFNCIQAQDNADNGGARSKGMDALTPGARAALELRLQDAKRDLARAIDERNSYVHEADVYRALADEAAMVHTRVSRNAHAIKLRLRAASMDIELTDHRSRIAMLEGMLAGKVETPVVLSAEQCAAVDETIGALHA